MPEVLEVGANRLGDSGVLDLDRHAATVVGQRGEVDLADRGGADRLLVELAEDLARGSVSRSRSMTFFMSLKGTTGAESRSSASLACSRSVTSGGSEPLSRKEATWPTFIAAPFIWPSTSTICSAALIWRRSAAARRPSWSRVRFATLVAPDLAASEPASRPSLRGPATRPLGIDLSWSCHGVQSRDGPPRP